jgi:hypothetical protein
MRDTDGGKSVIDIYSEDSDEDDEYVTLFQRSLEVASGEDFWVLDPTETGPDGEWAAYLFEPKYGELERFAIPGAPTRPSGWTGSSMGRPESLARFPVLVPPR